MKLEHLLFEGRLEDATKDLSPEQLEKFQQVVTLGVPSKYYAWITKHYIKHWMFDVASPEEVADLLKQFDSIKPPRDINSVPSLDILSKMIHEWNIEQEEKNRIKQAEQDYNTLFASNDYLVVRPNSVEASCKLGKDTKWCISAKEANYFQSYVDQGIDFVFLINKKLVKRDPYAKVAIAFVNNRENNDQYSAQGTWLANSYEIYDSTDKLKTIDDVWKMYPKQVLDVINNFFRRTVIPTNDSERTHIIQGRTDIPDQIQGYLEDYTSLSEPQKEVEHDYTQQLIRRINWYHHEIPIILERMTMNQIETLIFKFYGSDLTPSALNPEQYSASIMFAKEFLKQELSRRANENESNALTLNSLIRRLPFNIQEIVNLKPTVKSEELLTWLQTPKEDIYEAALGLAPYIRKALELVFPTASEVYINEIVSTRFVRKMNEFCKQLLIAKASGNPSLQIPLMDPEHLIDISEPLEHALGVGFQQSMQIIKRTIQYLNASQIQIVSFLINEKKFFVLIVNPT